MRVPISEWRFSPQVTIVSMRWSRYRPNESHPFLLTAIYASPNFSKRKILWNYLKNFASSVDLPWILLGDFNDMLEENDKIGELPFNGNRIAAFRECVGWILNPWSVKCKHLWLTDPSFPSLVKKSWVSSEAIREWEYRKLTITRVRGSQKLHFELLDNSMLSSWRKSWG